MSEKHLKCPRCGYDDWLYNGETDTDYKKKYSLTCYGCGNRFSIGIM